MIIINNVMQEDNEEKLLEIEEEYQAIFDSDEDDTEESMNGDALDLHTEKVGVCYLIYFIMLIQNINIKEQITAYTLVLFLD